MFYGIRHCVHYGQKKSSYVEAIKVLNTSLVHGDIMCYCETHICWSRPLQCLRTARTIAKIMENPQLQNDNWVTFTMDVGGSLLILTTFSEKGRNLLMVIRELNGREEKNFPSLNRKRTEQSILFGLANAQRLGVSHKPPQICSSYVLPAKKIGNPSRSKPLGSKRLFRLTVQSVLAPREVFTPEGLLIPISEVTSNNGAVAQVIHKRSRLNSYLPLSLSKDWKQGRSFVTAAGPGPEETQRATLIPATRAAPS